MLQTSTSLGLKLIIIEQLKNENNNLKAEFSYWQTGRAWASIEIFHCKTSSRVCGPQKTQMMGSLDRV
jgi:hypothetical protein